LVYIVYLLFPCVRVLLSPLGNKELNVTSTWCSAPEKAVYNGTNSSPIPNTLATLAISWGYGVMWSN
jgi:hypothetical protein